jgi:hypothetical protein
MEILKQNMALVFQIKLITETVFHTDGVRPWSSESSGMYCRVLKSMSTDVSEVRAAFIIMVRPRL